MSADVMAFVAIREHLLSKSVSVENSSRLELIIGGTTKVDEQSVTSHLTDVHVGCTCVHVFVTTSALKSCVRNSMMYSMLKLWPLFSACLVSCTDTIRTLAQIELIAQINYTCLHEIIRIYIFTFSHCRSLL